MRPITTSALVAIGLTLGACGPVNRSLYSVNQPVVSRSDYVFEARTGSDGLGAGEADRLAGWFDSLQLGYGDHVSLDDPSASPTARDAVAGVAARYGLLLSPAAPVTAGAPQPGSLRVVVSRSVAGVPNCPNWDRKSASEMASSTMSNYGCAVNTNLAAMVADPEDLIHGREGDAGGDSRVAIKAIRTFREAETTGKSRPTLGPTTNSTTAIRGN